MYWNAPSSTQQYFLATKQQKKEDNDICGSVWGIQSSLSTSAIQSFYAPSILYYLQCDGQQEGKKEVEQSQRT